MADLSLSQLRILLAVVRTGSFTAAAVELNLTQSGVSHAVQGLEEALGARLLDRHARGVQLTPAGLRALPLARHLLEEATRLQAEARAVTPLSGSVTIASFPSLALHFLPPVLAQVRSTYPGIDVQVSDAFLERHAVEAAVLRGEADIGLTQLPAHTRLMTRVMGDDPYELLLPATWPTEMDVATLWEQPYLHLGPATDDFVMQHLRRSGISLRPTLCLLTESVIVAMVGRELGFTALPRLALPGLIGEGLPPSVVRRPLPVPLVRTLGTVTRPGEHSPASRQVLGLIWAQGLPAV
ncbi:LysR family transcriptional regulator [Deinococcus frigens]|uniref:LysR family transcriptional regulator n=1 Tax=Deinococcus frigens TaxID=249403 RepID=UPI00068B9369|nr:LysR family transcriptional regulator [Deinococcus frigens]